MVECNGDENCCTPNVPCNEGEGDCDSDADCKSGLICGHNNCGPKDGQESWNPTADALGLVNDCCVSPKDGNLFLLKISLIFTRFTLYFYSNIPSTRFLIKEMSQVFF